MEPGAGLTILGAAVGGAKVLEKLLGPSAEYLGDGLKSWTEKRVQNVGRIFSRASEKLGAKSDSPGAVPPKLLKGILDDGSFCDNDLAVEYLAGILASGRTENGRDDRSASFVHLATQLSAYELRFHFIAYSIFRTTFLKSGLRPSFGSDLRKMFMFLPYSELNSAMAFIETEPVNDILEHCISGLLRHDLMKFGAYGNPEIVNDNAPKYFEKSWKPVEQPGILIGPAIHGIDLFLWAAAGAALGTSHFLDSDIEIPELPDVKIPTGAISLHNAE